MGMRTPGCKGTAWHWGRVLGGNPLRTGEPRPPAPSAPPANHKFYPRAGRSALRDARGAELSHWLAVLAGAVPRRAGGSDAGAAVSRRDVGAQRGAARAGGRRRGRGQRQLRGGRIRSNKLHAGPDQLLLGSPGGEERLPAFLLERAAGVQPPDTSGVPAAERAAEHGS